MHPARDTGAARAETPPNPSRRAWLAGSTAALLAGAAVVTRARATPVASPGDAGDDAELIALAKNYVAASAEIRRMEAAVPDAPDEAYEPLDARRFMTEARATALPATALAGLHAKAMIIVGEVELRGAPITEGTLADLAESLARDVLRIAGPPAKQTENDAELIQTCHAFLAADREIAAVSATDWEDDAISGPLDRRWYAAMERLTALPARTPAGRQAKANAAYVALKSTGVGCGLEREENAALAALADLTGRTAP